MSYEPRQDRLSSHTTAEVAQLYLRVAHKILAAEAPDFAKAIREIDNARFWAEEAERLRKAGR